MDKITFFQTIRQLIADGKTDQALTLMREQVGNFDSSLVKDATLLESRYNNASNAFDIEKTLLRSDYDITINQINYSLLEIVEKLEKSAPLPTSTSKSKNSGRILHNIPGTMPVGKERRCIVRIAYDDETLLRDLKQDENTVIQSVRIAEVMGVELVDFNETPAFSIRTITEEDQFISVDDYTQWLFMVKALREGKFPLTLKVAVIEEVNGKERRRDIVLEKEVFIISNVEEPAAAAPSPATVKEAPAQPVATQFEDSTIRFNYVVSEEKGAVASTTSKRFSMSGVMSTIGVIIMAMVGYVTFQKFGGAERPDIVLETQKGDQNGSNKGNSSSSTPSDTLTKSIETPINQTPQTNQLAENGSKNEDKNNNQAGPNKPPVKSVEPKNGEITGTTHNATNDKASNKAVPNAAPNNKGNAQMDKSNGKSPIVLAAPKPPQPKPKPVKPKPKPNNVPPATEPTSTPVTEPKIHIGDVNITPTTTDTGSKTEKEAPVKSFRVRLVLKGEMKKAEISVDGQSVDKFLKKNIWGTPQYIEFKSSKERHTITFKRGQVSCSVTDILIENGDLKVEPCSFE